MVVLCSHDDLLAEELPEDLALRAPDIEVQVVASLQSLDAHLCGLRPDALVIDIQAIADDDLSVFLEIENQRKRQTIVVDASSALPQRRKQIMGAGFASYFSRGKNHVAEITDQICEESARAATKDQIAETEQHYRTILEASDDGIFVLIDDVLDYVNGAFAKLTGKDQTELVGKLGLMDVISDSHDQAIKQELQRLAVSDGAKRLLNVVLDGPQGKRLLELSCSSSIVDGKRAVVGVARDVTIIREMQQDVTRTHEQAAQAERLQALGEVAAGIAHDFNNSLGTIMGRVELAQEKYLAGRSITEELGVIHKASRNAAATVRRIQEFSRPGTTDHWQEIKLGEIARDSIEFVATRCPPTVKIVDDIQASPSFRGNGEELREVLVNLINNAIDAVGDTGKIEVQVFAENGCGIIIVRDDGPGVDDATKRRMFEPFFTTKGRNGTGLGLSISQLILRRHDADIELRTEEGKGCEFRIVFNPLPSEKSENRKLNSASLQVLIVDDDETVADMVGDWLKEKGHRIDIVTDAAAALSSIQNNVPELMLTDLDLPDMGGWQLAQHIRKLHPDLVIGLMTGWPVDADERELQERGVDFVLSKPFSLDALTRALAATPPKA